MRKLIFALCAFCFMSTACDACVESVNTGDGTYTVGPDGCVK